MKLNKNAVMVWAIILFITLSLAVMTSGAFTVAQAKKSSSHHRTSKSNKPGAFEPGTTGGGFAVQPPPGTEPLTPPTDNNSAAALAISHRLTITSVNASKTQLFFH